MVVVASPQPQNQNTRLPDSVSDERINTFFSTYGRVHQIERSSDGIIVSFMDVRSAQKAHAGDHRLDSGQPFKIVFHEPGTAKNGLMTTSLSIAPNGTASPKPASENSRRRTPSPKGKDNSRANLARLISNAGKRLVRSEGHRREQGRSPDSANLCGGSAGPLANSGSICASAVSSGGLQGVYVERLPPRSDGTVKEAIRDALKKHGRIVDISIDGDGDARKALVIFQRVVDMEKLVNDSHISILSMRVRIRAANHVVVQEAYNDYLSLNSPAGSLAVVGADVDLPAKYASPNGCRNDVDAFHPKASRTLYVGGLESRISDDTLRRRFGRFGTILDVDVKNYESPSPFAFIQFADIESAVRAINAHSTAGLPANKKGKKFQPNFGRSMTTNKLWIGSIPPQCAEDYVIQKLRSLSEGVVDVVVDMRARQAIVVFSSTDGAQAALNRIKAGVPKQFVFKVESGEARVPADFCSDRLHDHFIDRKHGSVGPFILGTASLTVDDSLTALLAPPPDPPSDMSSCRYEHHRDQRRSPAHTRRRERSRERSQDRSRHRKSKYDYEKGFLRRKERKERKPSASSESSISSSEDSSLTRRRSGSNDSRASSSLSYSQRNKDRRRDDRRDVRSDRNVNGKQRNSSSSRRSPLDASRWKERKISRHSPSVSEERTPQTMTSSVVVAASDTAAPTPDDRKSGDSGFYEDVSRPPLDPPPAPPPMETLPHLPSPPPADPPVRRKPSPRPNSHSHSMGHFISPPSTSRHDSQSTRHQLHHHGQEIQSITVQHRHQSLSCGPGPSNATSSNYIASVYSQKRPSVDGQSGNHARLHPPSQQPHRTRAGKWPWSELLRSPCMFSDSMGVALSDPRPPRYESSRVFSSHLPLPPFADRQPRPVAGEWRKRSSGSAASADGVHATPQRRESGGSGITSITHLPTVSISEERPGHSRGHHSYGHSNVPTHATVSRSSSSSGGSGVLDSDAQLSPDAAPLPPPPPSALDLLCEPDDVPILADGWSGRLAEIGSRLTDVNASLEEAHRGVAELDDRRHRCASVSLVTEVTPTSSRQRPAGMLGSTPRTDSFEERLRSINQKKKSSFDDFTLNITQERIQAAKASAPDQLGVTPFSGLSTASGLSSSGFRSTSQSTATTPASSRLDSPSSSRKNGAPPSSTPTSRQPPSAPSTSGSTPVHLAAPPTAPTSPILSAPPPPPQLLPATQESVNHRDVPMLKSPTYTSTHCPPSKSHVTSSSSARMTHIVHPTQGPIKAPVAVQRQSNEKHLPPRHDSMSALKSPVFGASLLTGRSLSVSDSRKTATTPIAHKDPSTELLAGLFHNKPPTTDFRKLPKIEKKPSAVSSQNEKDHNQELSKKHSMSVDHHKKEKDHKPRRKEDGSFETKEERAKRKEAERTKKEREKTKDQKREKKVKEERKKFKEEEKEKERKKAKKAERERQREKKQRKQKKRSRYSCSDEDSSSDDSDYQKAFTKQLAHLVAEDSGSSCTGASGGLSMYDRVKRRSSAANKDDGTKKTAALQRLRDKNNERKIQKRIRVQLESSDDEEEGHSCTRKAIDSEAGDSSEEEEGVRMEKGENVDTSDEEGKKKHAWSTDESDETDAGNRKQRRKSGKKVSDKHQKHSKNINMDDVFGADSTDSEKHSTVEEREKKRKKVDKESSDENDLPKKKLGKSDRLDFESIFGPDKPQKSHKGEKERREKQQLAEMEVKKKEKEKKDITKRRGDEYEMKPAKRPKKSVRSDESTDSEENSQSAPRTVEGTEVCQQLVKQENEVCLPLMKLENDEQPPIMEHDVTERKPSESGAVEVKSPSDIKPALDQEETVNFVPEITAVDANQELLSVTHVAAAQAPLPTSVDQSRPKLVTKAAMKIFIPCQSAVASSTLSVTQPSTEVDSDEESTDYDDVFAAALSAPDGSQQNVTSSDCIAVCRTSTSSSTATEHEDVSESDSDSHRSRHRTVELVDAAAGYASVLNIDDPILSSDEAAISKECDSAASPIHGTQPAPHDVCKESCILERDERNQEQQQQLSNQDTFVVSLTVADSKAAEHGRSFVNEEVQKAAHGISDVQETEDAVKSIFDGDDEEEEPQYPTLVFVPGKNGAVVASAALSTASEVAIASSNVATPNDEANRIALAVARFDEDVNDANVASGDVSDEQLLRESFVEEPILEEKPAADKSVERQVSQEQVTPMEQSAPSALTVEADDDVVEVPCTELSSKETECSRNASYQQPITSDVTAPISVAIPDQKVHTPIHSPKVTTTTEQATFVQPPMKQQLKASPVSTAGYVSALPSASPATGGITQGTPVMTQQQQQIYHQVQAQRPLSQQQQQILQQQLAQQHIALQQQQQQQLLAQQQLELQQREREVVLQKERELHQQRERELQQQHLVQKQLLQQQHQQKEAAVVAAAVSVPRAAKPQTPAATPSPAPQSATPVNQQQVALAAQATLQMQIQQMQMLQMASRDPVGYYQQMSQTFGQPMATALLAQIQAMQQLPTSQAQQYLVELQRQQQIKAQQESATTVSPSPQPAHLHQQQQERERILKESQLRVMREREAVQAQQQAHAQSTQQQQTAVLYAAQYRLSQQQLLQQQHQLSSQASPSASTASAAVASQSSGTLQLEHKSVALLSQPRSSESAALHSAISTASTTDPSPSNATSTSGHHADVAKLFSVFLGGAGHRGLSLSHALCRTIGELFARWKERCAVVCSPLRETEIGVKRSRKAAEPQHLSAFCLSSPEEPMNPTSAANPLSDADVQSVGDQTMNILNLAGAIAMNSLLTINQQSAVGELSTAAQLTAQNPLLANAAKMMISMNLMNVAASGSSDRPFVPNATADFLSLIRSQPDTAAQSVANLQQAMLLHQYAALVRGQFPAVNPQLAALQMSLKQRIAENGIAHSSDRKRSFPSVEMSSHVEEMRKRVLSDTSAFTTQQKSERTFFPHVPVSKDDMERCLDRILNEEIYNIYEDEIKPEQNNKSLSLNDNSKETGCNNSGACSPIERKLSIDEILDIIANRSAEKDEGGIASAGSAFRKVSSRSHLLSDYSPREVITDTLSSWATSLSPAGSSPRCHEPEVAPLSQELINQLRDLALSHRGCDHENLNGDAVLTTDEQLKRFPVVWQGTLAMKQSETTVQMHLVYGSVEMLTRCLGDANADPKNAVPIRVNQRMRLEHAQVQGMVAKMSDAGRFACMICLPCGLSRDEIITNSDIFRTAFIDYFTNKQAAGIAVMSQTATTAGCLVHVFPPGEFPSMLAKKAPYSVAAPLASSALLHM
ncbi:hypothetical protein RB195_018566 [Necator americanus]|uniref:RRM domain-containing protein n=1 Tax=Necator americanus TaxID=51031 RepID=A0ABR1CAB3_NECAM